LLYTNALAYFAATSVTKKQTKRFITLAPAETDTASRTKVDTKVTLRATRPSKLVGIEHESDVTSGLPEPAAAEPAKTVSVTKVIRRDVVKRPVQEIHLEGVNTFERHD
jgi:hypothetical protein